MVSGEGYMEMLLRDWLLHQLQQIDIFNSGELLLQQDGAPPHWSRAVRDGRDTAFPNHWIGRGGPISWPLAPLIRPDAA